MKRLVALSLIIMLAATSAGMLLAQAGGQPATLVVRVPADATVIVGSQTTKQRGTERQFVTPELAPGFSYSYQVEARWIEAGKEVKVTRVVEITPGKTAVVDLRGDSSKAVAKQEPKAAVPLEPKIAKQEPKSTAPLAKKSETKSKTESPPPPPTKMGAKSRTFLFTYGGTVKDLKPGESAMIWLPVAVSTAEQTVSIEKKQLPGEQSMQKDPQYGNLTLFAEAKADAKGEIPFSVTYKVTRHEVKTDAKANLVLKAKEQQDKLMRFLQPDAKVPITGKPLDLIKERKLPADQFAAAKVLYEVVNSHMKYSKDGIGWGQGDAVWACDSKFGNCTDFHSLFISMARGNKIPAKFEMGFSIPTKRGEGPIGGYHCWAWFMPDAKGWVPVDISEANRFPEMTQYYFGNLTEDRVQFTTGRDIHLEPRQEGPALNFLIYPYVEVGGKTYPAEKVARSFAYQDLP